MDRVDEAKARLRKLGGDELLRKMVAAFSENGALKVTAAVEGLATGDVEQVSRAAHSLKSSAATFGAERLRALTEEIELKAAGVEPSRDGELERLVKALPTAFAEIRDYLAAREREP